MNHEKEKDLSVYEIGYLIVSSIPEEKIAETSEAIKQIITDAGAKVIAEEAPVRQPLEYTMRRKMVSGAYEKYDIAYFGWIKFELGSTAVENIKKLIDIHPAILRNILIKTIRENTYIGKRSLAVMTKEEDVLNEKTDENKDAAPASIEEMDKSIDDMVKEA